MEPVKTKPQFSSDEHAQRHYEQTWGKPFNANLEILHFFEFPDKIDLLEYTPDRVKRLEGLKFVPCYGCMLARPSIMRHEKNYHGLMESILASLGATPPEMGLFFAVLWYLSDGRPPRSGHLHGQ
jgi:heterodisulfide reductase subunit B